MDQRRIAHERAEKGVCILCEDDATRITRGLCVKHHTRYLTARKRVEAKGGDPDAYDEYLIGLGLLLPSRKGKRLDPSENVFDETVADFLGLPSPEAAEHQAKKSARQAADVRTSSSITRIRSPGAT